MLPVSLLDQLKDHFNTDELSLTNVNGGDINQAAKIETGDGREFFIKWNEHPKAGMFLAEAKGLQLLGSATSGLYVPSVISSGKNYLVLDWISQGQNLPRSSHQFGIELARLHKNTSDSFGLGHDNYIGSLKQSNTMHSNWPDFFAIERIEPQLQVGIEAGKIDRTIFKMAQKLYKQLGNIFPAEPPSLLHGDLWSGNYMFDIDGRAAIYDPAVYYGHREMDIAMTRLFGGFSAEFYQGYNEEYALEDGFEKRIKLCNLYPILVHANLFGGSYSGRAEQIIRYYA